MSPGPTFERVYLELKRQLREGTRPPGTPLEPAAIGDELGTSFTPVRDALHRLVGEGMVENPLHNGFAVPRLSEQALRDLYAWNGDVLTLAASRIRAPIELAVDPSASAAAQTAALFRQIADGTGNSEHVRAVERLSERLEPYRRIEDLVFADAEDERLAMRAFAAEASRSPLSRVLARYHKRRIAAAARTLAALQAEIP